LALPAMPETTYNQRTAVSTGSTAS
jgi:hypothetical protein